MYESNVILDDDDGNVAVFVVVAAVVFLLLLLFCGSAGCANRRVFSLAVGASVVRTTKLAFFIVANPETARQNRERYSATEQGWKSTIIMIQ